SRTGQPFTGGERGRRSDGSLAEDREAADQGEAERLPPFGCRLGGEEFGEAGFRSGLCNQWREIAARNRGTADRLAEDVRQHRLAAAPFLEELRPRTVPDPKRMRTRM